MNAELIERLLALVEKTGDKVVLADPRTGKNVVLMPLDQYEKMLGLAAKELPTQPRRQERNLLEEVIMRDRQEKKLAEVSPVYAGQAPQQPPQYPAPEMTQRPPMPNAFRKVLTERATVDKITRDIGTWKTAQDKRRTEEVRATVEPAHQVTDALEDEERFYLEPLE